MTLVSTEAAVQQDTQQSGPNQEPLTTDTLQLMPLLSCLVESSTEESKIQDHQHSVGRGSVAPAPVRHGLT